MVRLTKPLLRAIEAALDAALSGEGFEGGDFDGLDRRHFERASQWVSQKLSPTPQVRRLTPILNSEDNQMSTIPDLDREADRLFGLTVELKADRKWHVMSNERSLATCPGYEDATHERMDIIESYLPKLDQISIDGLLSADRAHALRVEIIRDFNAPVRGWGHVFSLIVFEVEWNGSIYRGEDYESEENALIVLLANLRADNAWSAASAPLMQAAE